jgi:hypothetical protein
MENYERKINAEARKCLYTHAGESWQEALERLKRLCHLDIDQYEDDGNEVVFNFANDYDNGGIFSITHQEPIARIQNYESSYGISIPSALKSLLLDHGAFRIFNNWGEGSCLAFYDSKELRFPNIKPYSTAISFNFTNQTHAITELSIEQKKFLDTHYFFFGYLRENDQQYNYLYFTRDGDFGEMYFEDENAPKTRERSVLPMLEGRAKKFTLDALLTTKIDRAIRFLLESYEVVMYDEIIV